MKKNIEDKQNSKNKIMADVIVYKNCPLCKVPLSDVVFSNMEVDYCPKCYGMWFEEDELRLAKDAKEESLKWLDIDLWKDEKKFKVAYGIRLCPSCRVPLYEIYYGDSKVIVDVCNLCRGVWLDRAEFKKIINWLKERANYEIMKNYFKNLFRQATEVFSGPDSVREEIEDVIIVFKLLGSRFSASHPNLAQVIARWPR